MDINETWSNDHPGGVDCLLCLRTMKPATRFDCCDAPIPEEQIPLCVDTTCRIDESPVQN
jgi:hypothetical protein